MIIFLLVTYASHDLYKQPACRYILSRFRIEAFPPLEHTEKLCPIQIVRRLHSKALYPMQLDTMIGSLCEGSPRCGLCTGLTRCCAGLEGLGVFAGCNWREANRAELQGGAKYLPGSSGAKGPHGAA